MNVFEMILVSLAASAGVGLLFWRMDPVHGPRFAGPAAAYTLVIVLLALVGLGLKAGWLLW